MCDGWMECRKWLAKVDTSGTRMPTNVPTAKCAWIRANDGQQIHVPFHYCNWVRTNGTPSKSVSIQWNTPWIHPPSNCQSKGMTRKKRKMRVSIVTQEDMLALLHWNIFRCRMESHARRVKRSSRSRRFIATRIMMILISVWVWQPQNRNVTIAVVIRTHKSID